MTWLFENLRPRQAARNAARNAGRVTPALSGFAVLLGTLACGGGGGLSLPDTPTLPAAPTQAVETPTTAAVPDPTQTPAGTNTIYTVESGDTLSEIAEQFDVTVDAILELNQIEDANLINVGDEILIPAP